MKPKYFYIALSLAVVVFLTFNAFTSDKVKYQNSNETIIKFSHKVHAELTDCQSCHSKVTESKSIDNSLFPNHTDCQSCHDTEDKTSCQMCHYENEIKPLENRKVNLRFNHSSHISKDKINCNECHQGVTDVDYAFKAAKAFPVMSYCNKCHNNYQGIAPNQCEACHKSTAGLIPESHKSADFTKSHKFDAQKNNANCQMCHDNSSCQECHTVTNMLNESNTGTNFYTPYSPSNFQTDGAKKQPITRAHDLNYVYTHGIDLKGGTSECQTCHQTETFCVPCHNDRKADFSLAGVQPASHRVRNFITLGVGSGGGEHATEARRDIESCQSCHDTQGNDPNCITCHIDSDGIKGTNPKTHSAGFMHDVHGDWHDSEGAVCFNCHNDTHKPGQGFCGYCHSDKVND
ncbi:MAG: cytochrome c3 family protein [Ignavibacteria bacterium]